MVFLLIVLKPHIAGAVAGGVFGSARALPVLGIGGTVECRRAMILGQGRRGAPALARAVGEVDCLGVVRRHRSRGGGLGMASWWWLW